MFTLFRRRKKAPGTSLLDSVIEGYDLPRFPAIITELLSDLSKEDASLTAIAGKLAVDPGLSVSLLRTVNSAAFALRNEIRSVQHAAQLLGRAQFESMLISIAARKSLPATPSLGYVPARFWTSAARRASIAASFARRICPSSASECFTAALLQDLALPLLVCSRRDEYGAALERWHAGEGELVDIERETFGWDHAQLGGEICRRWGMPEIYASAIARHHGSEPHEDLPVVPLTGLIPEQNPRRAFPKLVSTAERWFGLSDRDALEIAHGGEENTPELAAVLSRGH